MHPRPVISLAMALCAMLATTRAYAWHEAHEAADEARVRVDARGVASVEHLLKWRIVHGPLQFIDLAGVDAAAVLDPAAIIRTEDGRSLTARVARKDDSVVRVWVDTPKALSHGVVTFEVKWQVDLVAIHALVADGETWRLSWSMPVAESGFDLPRITFELPAAPEPPRAIGADLAQDDDGAGAMASLRRDGAYDTLAIVRPYAARGEAIAGAIRLDPRALPQVADPMLRPPHEPPQASEPRPRQGVLWIVALGLIGVGFGWLVAAKDRAFEASCAPHRVLQTGLIPLPRGLRAALAGLALSAGVAMQIAGQSAVAGGLVALAVLCTTLRSPQSPAVARAPGRWLPIRPEHAFSRENGDAFAGWGLLASAFGVAVATWLVKRVAPQASWWVAMDCAPMIPLLLTGRSSQRPGVGPAQAAPLLSKAFSSLKAARALRVVPWARVRLDGAIDELRLLVLPRIAVPGVVGIELGHAWTRTPVGWLAAPEVLVRAVVGSSAAAKLVQIAPSGRLDLGRRVQERVVRIAPSSPGRAACVALVCRLADHLTDRRLPSSGPAWQGSDRRVTC